MTTQSQNDEGDPPSLSLVPTECDVTTAQARALSLFLVRDPSIRATQIAHIRAQLGESIAQAVEHESMQTDASDRPERLTRLHNTLRKEDAGRKPEDIMFDPYRRIVALHIAILLGSFAVVGTGAGSAVPALLILIAIKIAIDLHQHRAAHRKRRAESRQVQDNSMP